MEKVDPVKLGVKAGALLTDEALIVTCIEPTDYPNIWYYEIWNDGIWDQKVSIQKHLVILSKYIFQ